MLNNPSTKLEEKIKNISPNYYWLVAAMLSSIIYLFIFSVSDMLPNGRYTVLRLDMPNMYLPIIEYFTDTLKGNHGYWFSWSNFWGYGNSGMFGYLCLSPFNLIFMLFSKENAVIAVTIVIVLKCAASAAFMQLFLSYFFRSKRFSTVVFAVFYSLNAYQITYYCALNLTDAIYILPLVMLSITVLFRKGKALPLAGAYFLLFLSCFYMGYMIGINSFILGAGYYFYTFTKREKRVNCSIVVKYCTSVLTALLMSAAIWLPAIEQIIQFGEDDYRDADVWNSNILPVLNNMFIGEYQSYDGYYPYIYCGILSLALVFFYFFNNKIKRRERIYAGIMIGIYFVIMLVPGVNYFMHAFDTPQMLGYRYSFVFSFIICVVACRESSYYRNISIKPIIMFTALCAEIYTVSIFYYSKEVHEYNCNRPDVAIVNILFILIWISIQIIGKKRLPDAFTYQVLVITVAACELIVNGTMILRFSDEYNYNSDCYRYAEASIERTLDELELPGENEFFRTQTISDILTNSGINQGLYSTNSYYSIANGNLLNTLHKLGVEERVHTIISKGYTPMMRTIFNIKNIANVEIEEMENNIWILYNEGDLMARFRHEKGIQGSGPVAENDYVLALGYMVNDDVKNIEFGASPFENQNELISKMCGSDFKIFKEINWECETSNGNLIPYEKGIEPMFDEAMADVDMSEGFFFVADEGIDQEVISRDDASGLSVSIEKIPTFTFSASDRGKSVYAYFARHTHTAGYAENSTVDETVAKEYSGPAHALSQSSIMQLGHNEQGDYEAQVVLPKDCKIDYCEGICFAEYDEDAFMKAYETLSTNQLAIEQFDDGYVKGRIDAGDGGIMFTSIPYAKGWNVTVDGKQVESVALIEGAFMGLDLSGGEHVIEMKYYASGSTEGIILSILGIALMAGIFVTEKRNLFENARKVKGC